jgi:hypothetical protein
VPAVMIRLASELMNLALILGVLAMLLAAAL